MRYGGKDAAVHIYQALRIGRRGSKISGMAERTPSFLTAGFFTSELDVMQISSLRLCENVLDNETSL